MNLSAALCFESQTHRCSCSLHRQTRGKLAYLYDHTQLFKGTYSFDDIAVFAAFDLGNAIHQSYDRKCADLVSDWNSFDPPPRKELFVPANYLVYVATLTLLRHELTLADTT